MCKDTVLEENIQHQGTGGNATVARVKELECGWYTLKMWSGHGVT